MSYLQLAANPMVDNAKGVISFWFRFSQDALDAAKAYGEAYTFKVHPEEPKILQWTIPFITFGRVVSDDVWGTKSVNVAVPPPFIAFVPWPEFVTRMPAEPSHIGVSVQGVLVNGVWQGRGEARIRIVFKMETAEQARGYVTKTDKVVWSIDPVSGTYKSDTYVSDISYVRIGPPAKFSIDAQFTLAPDKWHHMLLSYDFTAGCAVAALPNYKGTQPVGDTTSAYAKIWYAVDDVHRSGKDDMGAYWVEKDDNGIISEAGYGAIGSYNPAPPPPNLHGNIPPPSYQWSGSVPLNKGHVGIPAAVEYVETIYHCEMAEFQMWTGVTLDTSIESNRRAFVDAKGKPVQPKGTEADPRGPAEKLLGKKPELMLHGNGNWQKGLNTGSLGITTNPDGDVIEHPAGQFVPTAKIEKYKPEPALTETPTA